MLHRIDVLGIGDVVKACNGGGRVARVSLEDGLGHLPAHAQGPRVARTAARDQSAVDAADTVPGRVTHHLACPRGLVLVHFVQVATCREIALQPELHQLDGVHGHRSEVLAVDLHQIASRGGGLLGTRPEHAGDHRWQVAQLLRGGAALQVECGGHLPWHHHLEAVVPAHTSPRGACQPRVLRSDVLGARHVAHVLVITNASHQPGDGAGPGAIRHAGHKRP